MTPFGNIPASSVLPIFFDTFAGSTGAPITMSGFATSDILVYKGTSMTQRASTAGFTLLDTDGIDLDGITGIQGFSIDLSDNTDAGFYAAGSFYTVVVSTVTVDSQTMSFIAATFRIVAAENTAGTPVVDTGRIAGTAQTAKDLGAINVTNLNTLSGHDPGATLGTSTLTQAQVTGGAYALQTDASGYSKLSTGTGTGQLDFTSGVVKANLAQILGTALTETAGQIAAAFKKFFDKASPTGTINSLPDAVPGASNALLINGSNSGAVTLAALTVTGALTVSDGIAVAAATTNRAAISLAGNGTGPGLKSVGGATAPGMEAKGGATSGDGFYAHGDGGGNGINAAGTGGTHGMQLTGQGSGDGLSAQGGSSGRGGHFTGGTGSGAGFRAEVQAANGNGFEAVGAGTGNDISGNMTGNITGNLSGSVGSVTARVTANTDQLAGQTVSAAAGVTFPSSVASPTNITAGTITTVTNLTNAPTAGDFTATMKTSLNAATPAVTVSDKTGFSLTSAYDAAKTAAQAGDAMTLTSAYDAAKTAAQAGDAMALTSGERTSTADALLNRDMSAVTVTNSRSPINALRALRNKVDLSSTPGTLKVKKEDDSTDAWTAAITTDATADPITIIDPA